MSQRLCAALAAAVCTMVPVAWAPDAAAAPPNTGYLDQYPTAEGNYSSPTDFYRTYFRTPDGRTCGISPNGGLVGCDAAPVDAPPDSNQTVTANWMPAEYRHADDPTFARPDIDVLPEGYRLQNSGTVCGMGHQGAVTCRTSNNHGFVLAAGYAVLW